MTAYQMQVVATGWTVYELTNNPLDLGLVGLVQFLPRIALTLWAGRLADRYDRRKIALFSTATQAIACGCLAYASSVGALRSELVFLLIAIIGASRSFEMPSMQAMLPSLLTPKLFPRGMALSTAATQAAIIGGPALAGFVLMAGASMVYWVATLLFIFAASMMFVLPSMRPTESRNRDRDSLFAGIHFIVGKPVILGAISLDLFAVLLGGATAMLPIFAKDILHVGPTGLGLLQAAPAIGALATTGLLARYPLRRGIGRSLFFSVAIFGLATILFAISTSFWLSLVTLVVLGASDCVSVVIRQSLVQLETPDEMRGRVSAVNSVFIGASNQLGEFESGVVAALIGTVPSVVLGGFGTLLVTAGWMALFPSLLRRDTIENQTPSNS